MRPNNQELLRGIKTTLVEVVAPELQTAYARAQLGLAISALDMVTAQWDTEAQSLLDENRSLTVHFQEAADALRSVDVAARDGLVELANELVEAAQQKETKDCRLSTLAERNNHLKALLVRLVKVCDEAMTNPDLKPLLRIREIVLQEMQEKLAARSLAMIAVPQDAEKKE